MSDNILRRKQVEQRCGLARSTIYHWISKGRFPAPILLGKRAVGWLESEVDEWIADRHRSVGGANDRSHAA